DVDAGLVTNRATATAIYEDTDGTEITIEKESDTGTDAAGIPIENPETVDGDDEDEDPGNDPTVIEIPRQPAISLVKTSAFNDENEDTYSQPGETVTFTFVIKNTGNVTLTDIALLDDEDASFSGTGTLGTPEFDAWFAANGDELDETDYAGALAPSESVRFKLDYAITQADITAGVLTNQATVTGSDPEDDSTTDISGHDESDNTPTEVTLPPAKMEANDDTGDAINGYTGGTVLSGDGD